MKQQILFLILMLSLVPTVVKAQEQAVVSGTVTDSSAGYALPSATVSISSVSDPTALTYTTTDNKGAFVFHSIAVGNYVVNVSYVGYKSMEKTLKVTSERQTYTLSFQLKEDAQLLDEISVQGRATRAEQKGDSLHYNAEAFQVMMGSSAEDLLAKMPGIVVEGGTVQAQGEQVQKVLVDGKEFFDGDVNLAIKNLPSDIIASIEVFDKKSEQAEFTGFDDGEEVKTINIVTKSGFHQGTFGEVSGGYGTDNRYKVNGNINFFNDDRRISVLGMTNNVNQQNFSQEDLAGVMSSNANARGGRGGRGGAGLHAGYGAEKHPGFRSVHGFRQGIRAALEQSGRWTGILWKEPDGIFRTVFKADRLLDHSGRYAGRDCGKLYGRHGKGSHDA